MSVGHIFAALLLAAGVLIELLCCVGVLLTRRAMDRLHYLAPATAVGPILIAAAVLVDHSPPQAEIKSVIVALILLLTSPILSHATGRAIVGHSGRPEAGP